MKRTFLTFLPLILFYCAYHIVVMAGVGGGGVGSSPAVGSGSFNVSEFNATNYGAKSDGKLVTGVTTTATLATVTISGLTALDVGKDISIYTAATQSGSIYTGTISTVSGSTVTLSPGTVDASVAGTAVAKICTDNTTTIQAALDAVGDTTILRSGVVKLGSGATCINAALNVHGSVEFAGQGLSRASTSTPRASEVCVYRSDTGGPDGGGSNGEKKITMTGSGSLADGCVSMNFMNQFGSANNKITDTVASNSGGVSVPTTDATGQVVAVSSKLTATTVATLPSTCTAGQVRAVTDWNGTNGACTGSGANYTTATCGAANNWFCP